MKLFDDYGRRIPTVNDRVFRKEPSFYYKINQPNFDFNSILERAKKNLIGVDNLSAADFESKANSLLKKLKDNEDFSLLTNGVHVPFIYRNTSKGVDLGKNLEETILPALKESFTERFPDAHFKAVLQSNSELQNNIKVHPGSRYDKFLDDSFNGVIGWYFPQAFQEFDIDSQRNQMSKLPEINNVKMCLSGGMDIGAAVVGSPELLINKDHYSPILCMSSFVHSDERLVLLLKAYGPHMEFWCMTQMLSKNTTQVSEQWAGGLTIFSEF
ncbi:hypothetical protein OAI28_01135 [Methylophilaceae bacterium]|nr:hypothetical protein [Methylophilaceae bacterium]